jgi:hypothetical protein
MPQLKLWVWAGRAIKRKPQAVKIDEIRIIGSLLC